MPLRDYQAAAVDALRAVYDKRPLLVAPTGSGKTVMAGEVIRRATERGNPTLAIAHRMELIDQMVERLEEEGLRPGVVMAGRQPTPGAFVQVASVQTLVRRRKSLPRARLVVWDEAHHATASTYKSVMDAYPDACHLGLTATPFRTDGRPLGDVFGALVVAASTDELVDAGHLLEPVVFAPPGPWMKGTRKRGGDWAPEEVAGIMDRPTLTGDIVRTWQRHAAGKRTVAFACSVEHSQHLVAEFTAAGVPAAHVDGAMLKDKRREILADLRSGRLLVVVNCSVLTEGWDLPALECCVMARPTVSLGLHLQMVGRIMRPLPGKDRCLLLDHAGNTGRHGLVTDPLEYSLDADVRKRGEDEPRTTKNCPACFAVVRIHVRTCPHCGTEFLPQSRPPPEQVEGELERVTASGPLYPDAPPALRLSMFSTLLRTAAERGYRVNWARMRYLRLYGTWPDESMEPAVKAAQHACQHVRGEDDEGKPWACRFCGKYRGAALANGEPAQ